MAKKFTFRGKTLEELQKMDLASFLPLIGSRQRRSLTRGMTYAKKQLLAKVVAKSQGTYKKEIRTHCRDMVILPPMVGQLLHIYNGKEFVPLSIQPEMLGNFLGIYILTRSRVQHNAPGIGATKSSAGALSKK